MTASVSATSSQVWFASQNLDVTGEPLGEHPSNGWVPSVWGGAIDECLCCNDVPLDVLRIGLWIRTREACAGEQSLRFGGGAQRTKVGRRAVDLDRHRTTVC